MRNKIESGPAFFLNTEGGFTFTDLEFTHKDLFAVQVDEKRGQFALYLISTGERVQLSDRAAPSKTWTFFPEEVSPVKQDPERYELIKSHLGIKS